ncbi:MAG TPA: hypothetical protein VJ949_03020 [Cryomorphaceae bacterium]|nr:hypothetical protein [Cryomorphaceae bacterium]
MIEKDFSSDDVFLGMTEVERAFYAKFKLGQHSREKRKELLSALESSGLNRQKIEEITSEHSFKSSHPDDACNRCGSFKVYLHKSEGTHTAPHCLVCGYIDNNGKRSRVKFLNFLFCR